jgi:hypothetical protein
MKKTFRQPKLLIRNEMTFENMKVPTPAPQTVTPVASARSRSKYMVTITIAGQYIRPNPVPMMIPTETIKNSIDVAKYEMAHLKRFLMNFSWKNSCTQWMQ